MTTQPSKSTSEWENLCTTVKKSITPRIGEHAWEVIIAAVLIASPSPHLLAEYYTHLTQHNASYASKAEQERLSLRFRDTVLKLWTLVGSPQCLSALMPLAKAEGSPEQRAESSVLNPKWQNIDPQAILARGTKTIDTIYGPLLPKIFSAWGDHSKDFEFHELLVVYGLYLSDFEYMDPVETEAVVYATISCTGWRGPGLWHLRGMGRKLGARGTDEDTAEMRQIKDMLRNLKTGVMAVVEFVGEEYVRRANLESWANVGDVVRDLGGWGDDEQK